MTQEFSFGSTTYQVTIIPKRAVTVRTEWEGKVTCFTYQVGDYAEYDSYNLSYFGEITSITEKTVTIRKHVGDGSKRLKLQEFAWRNGHKSIAEKQQANQQTMMYI